MAQETEGPQEDSVREQGNKIPVGYEIATPRVSQKQSQQQQRE
eukprot:CAMPEP_0116830116 /NCGR_PEP_ID=MMETSP0418-20121206/4587_1 /TAXON_ID=1158023 /ORGANISM="Astrosyne radiata, Strain 13vi08-1A" /LENGTH=42 /DNA_ID= /DNA_START= /DNA_END= /DNA_ORIENTATION=